jgi:hypothetical protein
MARVRLLLHVRTLNRRMSTSLWREESLGHERLGMLGQ